MSISTGGKRSECKPGVQAARTYRNCKVHCRQLKTAQYSADSDNQGTLSSKTVYQQCCKARPPQLLVVYLSTFLFAQVLIRSERMYRCRRPIIFSLINLAFLTLFVTAILVVPLMRSMLGKREVEFKLRSVILPKQIEISMFMYYCNPGKTSADWVVDLATFHLDSKTSDFYLLCFHIRSEKDDAIFNHVKEIDFRISFPCQMWKIHKHNQMFV